jgi:dihydrofolate reductase
MGRIVVSEFVSLDGVMESPGGGEGFRHDAWTFEFDYGDGVQFKLDETMSSDALLLGRVTYEGFAEAWPSQEGDFADKLNAMPKHVVSTTLTNPEWDNSTVVRGDVVEAVADLKGQYPGDIVVHGSARLVQTLLEHDLVDELRLMVFPVVLGAGKRLFAETTDKKRFGLVDARTVGDGISILVLRPDRGGTDPSH